MKWAVYNLLFAAVYPFLLPGFLIRMLKRGGYAARMGDRFALYPSDVRSRFIPGRPVCGHEPRTANHETRTTDFVWIHAVSVGEVQVAGQLMREWRKVEPSVRFCFSTTSSTGWKIAEKELEKMDGDGEGGDVLIYNPLDFPNFVKSALKTVRPRAIVLTESEIWPNFILRAKKMGIPLFLINARVSDRSAPRYRFARFFFKDVFEAFTKIFAQSDLDASRIRAAMGGRGQEAAAPVEAAKITGDAASSPLRDNVVVTGSFKFDVAKRNEAKEAELREWIFGGKESKSQAEERPAKILLGGSTWPGEDKVLLDIYNSIISLSTPPTPTTPTPLSPTTPTPLLVLAPRHFEKADEVEANIEAAGFACIRRSRGESAATWCRRGKDSAAPVDAVSSTGDAESLPRRPPVFLCDTTGEMMGLFGICDAAFVGKSLCAHGSQNMIEPCLCGKPTFVGPYTENFRPVMSDLLAANAIVQVRDAAELKERIVALFSDPTALGGAESLPLQNEDVAKSSDSGGRDSSAPMTLGARAKAAVLNRRGVVPRCVKAIREELERRT